MQHARDDPHRLGAEVAANDVAAERQRQAAGALEPPFAQVHDLLEAVDGVGELALVDEQAGLDAAVHDGLVNLVERHDLGHERPVVHLQREKRRRHLAGDRDCGRP